jgi:hypothetical protein
MSIAEGAAPDGRSETHVMYAGAVGPNVLCRLSTSEVSGEASELTESQVPSATIMRFVKAVSWKAGKAVRAPER